MLKGTGASDGIGIGKILVIEEVSLAYTPHAVEDPDAELQRFKTAVDAFIVETQAQAEALKASAGAKEAEIMLGHISMVQDPALCGETENLIRGGQCAEQAFESMCDMFIMIFSQAADDFMRQRAADAHVVVGRAAQV